jgi:hypothetical protein
MDKAPEEKIPASRDWIVAAALSAAFAAFTAPWIYRYGAAEHDCLVMASAVWQALHRGTGLEEPLLYLPAGQPLYYLMLMHWPGAMNMPVDGILNLMNRLGWLAQSFNIGVFYLLVRRAVGPTWALAGVCAAASSPTVFEMATYGHPATLALLVFQLALLTGVGAWSGQRGTLTRLGRLGLVWAMVTVALLLRADIVYIFPATALLAAICFPRRYRDWATGGMIAVLAVLAFMLTTSMLIHGERSTGSLLKSFLSFLNLDPMRGLFYCTYASGCGLVAASLLVTTLVVWKRDIRGILILVAAVTVALLPPLTNPIPSRRFYYALFFIGLCLAFAGNRAIRLSMPKALMFGAAAFLLSFALPPLAQAAMRASFRQPAHWALRTLASGPIDNHRVRQAYLLWDRDRWARILERADGETLVVGRWLEMAGMILNLTRREALLERVRAGNDPALRWTRFDWRDGSIDFVEWYSTIGPDIGWMEERYSKILFAFDYTDEERRSLPAGETDAPPKELDLRPF